MGMPGPQELIIILVIVLLIFGGRKLPDLAKGLGEGIREFKKATKDPNKDVALEDKVAPPALDTSRDDKMEVSASR